MSALDTSFPKGVHSGYDQRYYLQEDSLAMKKICIGIHWFLLVCLFGVLTGKALLEFCPGWNILTYHLPAALKMFGATTFVPGEMDRYMIEGSPPLAPFLQGLFIYAGGRMSLGCAAGAACFLLTALVVKVILGRRFSLRWYLSLALSIPLFLFFYPMGYVDLLTASFLTLSFASQMRFCGARSFNTASFIVFLCASSLANLSKWTAWPIVALLSLSVLLKNIALCRNGKLAPLTVLILLLLIVLMQSVWPLRNQVLFGNPVYPVNMPFLESSFTNAPVAVANSNTEKKYMPDYLKNGFRPERFLYSVFELYRLNDDVPGKFRGLLGGWPYEHQGGFSYLTMTVLTACFALSLIYKRLPGLTSFTFLMSTLLISLLPFGFYLRYWIFLPLTLALFAGYTIQRVSTVTGKCMAVMFLMCMAFTAFRVEGVWSLNPSTPEDFAPSEARKYWASSPSPVQEPVCICGREPVTIYWSGPTFSEYKVAQCCDENSH